MRSIRLSLIVYFLVLLALALGGVSWFAYETTAQALRDKQASTKDLINLQCKELEAQIRTAIDDRITEKAEMLAGRLRFREFVEPLFPIAFAATSAQPQGHLNVGLWAFAGLSFDHAAHLFRSHEIMVKDTDDFLRSPDSETQDQEYFQIHIPYGGQPPWPARTRTQQRSENLGTRSLKLDEEIFTKPDFHAHPVTVTENGWVLRVVTIKATVRMPPAQFGRPRLSYPKFGNPRSFPGKGPRELPVFIQYASETSFMEERIDQVRKDRDEKLAEQDIETPATLTSLRLRLLWIALATFAGIVAGGFLLIRLGLAPLARLSDAVSKVSAKDFSLKVKPQDLPSELQPIAARLAGTLDQLKQAFAREKQAAADISHELRTPLAAMMATMDLALRKSRSAAEYRDLLGEIRASGDQMTHLVERLLALARLDAGADRLRTQEIDAREVARQCTSMIRPLAEARGLALTLHAPLPAPLKTDADKLREILNNLLHNAIEYNCPQGAIDLDVARVNGHVRLAVSDTGIGITPEQRAHIFERFFRADPSRHADTPHAGLGLAIVKSYVDLMGGTIGVDSGAKGSTFTVELPAL